MRVARPFSTVIRTPHASGQSCGQAACTTCFMNELWHKAEGFVAALPAVGRAELAIKNSDRKRAAASPNGCDLLDLANECRERLVEPPRLLVEQQVTAILKRVKAGAGDLRRHASAHLDPLLVDF